MQNNNQRSKYYHNDIKKQLGIDDSRTASQKLLDKFIRAVPNINQKASQFSQPKKKQKTTQQSIGMRNLQILQKKLIKNIQNQTNCQKLLKSLSIFQKCLNEQHFLNDQQIKFNQNWQKYTNILIKQISQKNYQSSEAFSIMYTIANCIQILHNKFGQIIRNKQQNQRQKINMFSLEQINVFFCRLFTDDSFVFNKYLAKIKKYIFSHFNKEQQPKHQIQHNNLKDNKSHMNLKDTKLHINDQQIRQQMILDIMIKLVSMSMKYDWANSSLINLFKQFNNYGCHNQFKAEQKKIYLKKYNQFLNKKVKQINESASNGSGIAKISQVKSVFLQNSGQGSDKWVSRQ